MNYHSVRTMGLGVLSFLLPALRADVPAGKTRELWPAGPPGAVPPIETGADPFGRALDPLRITDVAKPSLVCHVPARPDGRALVVCPGGAYARLSVIKDGERVAERFNRDGITVFVLHYRVPTPVTREATEGPRLDLAQALGIARERMAIAGHPAAKVGVIGFSAGGYLALAGAYGRMPEGTPRPDFVIAVYPAFGVDSAMRPLIDGDFQFTAGSAPACLLHSGDDRCLPDNSVQIWDRLRRQKVAAELHIFRSGGHGYGISDEDLGHTSHQWPEIALEWMRREPAAGGSSPEIPADR